MGPTKMSSLHNSFVQILHTSYVPGRRAPYLRSDSWKDGEPWDLGWTGVPSGTGVSLTPISFPTPIRGYRSLSQYHPRQGWDQTGVMSSENGWGLGPWVVPPTLRGPFSYTDRVEKTGPVPFHAPRSPTVLYLGSTSVQGLGTLHPSREWSGHQAVYGRLIRFDWNLLWEKE